MADVGRTAGNQQDAAPLIPVDAGLGCLDLVVALSAEALDFERARCEALSDGRIADRGDLVRSARARELKARASRASVNHTETTVGGAADITNIRRCCLFGS